MSVTVVNVEVPTLAPLSSAVGELPVANVRLSEWAVRRFQDRLAPGHKLHIRADLWASEALIGELTGSESNVIVRDAEGREAARKVVPGSAALDELTLDRDSLIIRYPWDLLAVNERWVGALKLNERCGTVREQVVIDGLLALGEGSVVLPGVYIEGCVVVGKNCKIGPNCYIRGNTAIGDRCHIGQAVEVKNSLLMDHVSIGHLSYVGDSVIASDVNFGAGTITSNLRHDGCNHRSLVEGRLEDTGRRKFGVIIGTGVHTGIHTGFYPGRKLGCDVTTVPGEIVRSDKY